MLLPVSVGVSVWSLFCIQVILSKRGDGRFTLAVVCVFVLCFNNNRISEEDLASNIDLSPPHPPGGIDCCLFLILLLFIHCYRFH